MAVFTAAAAIGASVLGTLGVTGAIATGVTFATVATGFAVQAAVGLALNALTPKPKIGSFSSSTSRSGYTVNQRGSALEHQIIYGKMRTGGTIVFDGTTGAENKFLHRVIAFTGHEIEDFDQIYINDEIATLDGSGNVISPSRYNGFVRIKKKLGTDDQLADADLVNEVTEWTSEHRLRGVSYLYVRFQFNQDVFPNGVPEVTAVVKGKKVFDPRTSTTSFSDNPALCLRDYILADYGLAEDPDNIDDSLVIAAANVCDETVSGTNRYTCNGAFTTATTPYDLLQDMLTSMGGLLWYAQGQWRMKPAYYVAPTVSFDEDDLRSSIAVQTRHSRRDNFNTVRGTFRGPETDYQITDYPEVSNEAFISADGGQESVADIELPFTDSSVTARRIARIALERNRQQITVQASFGLRAFQVQVGDVVNLSVDRFGWTQKEFEVVSWTFGLTDGLDLQVQMSLREISESVFDEVDDGIVYERDNTSLLSPFDVPNVGLSLDSELKIVNEQVFNALNITIQNDSDLIDYYEVEYKPSANSDFKSLGSGSSNKFELLAEEDGDFDIRARAVNTFGVRGNFTTFTNFSSRPFAPPPANVTNFSINVVGGTAQLSWDSVPDLDLSHYEVRFTPDASNPVWSNSVVLVGKVARPATSVSVVARQGTYLVKAVDKLGSKSVNATTNTVVLNLDDTLGLNVVQNYQEDPDFNGSKTDVVRVTDGADAYLTLDTSVLFDGVSGNFDDELGLFDGGGGNVIGTGEYEFENVLDLGAKYSSYVTSSINFQHLDYVNTFDSAPGLFDDRYGDFDGDPNELDKSSARVQFSITDDDPSGSPAWSDWQDVVAAEVSARAIRFKAILETEDEQVAPRVDELSAHIDMPDRTESGNDIDFTGSTNVDFNRGFYTTSNPAIGLSLTGLATGDYYEITSKDYEGFTLTVYDSTDTVKTTPTQLDYVAKGFGKEITA